MTNKPNLYIMGSGAIGSLIAIGFEKTNRPYHWILRNSSSPTKQGLDITETQYSLGDSVWDKIPFNNNDVVVLPLKAYHYESALRTLVPFLAPRTTLVCINNGMGVAETVANQLNGHSNPVFLATTSHGAYKSSAAMVKHTGLGRTVFGRSPLCCAQTSTTDIKSLLNTALPPAVYHENINVPLWEKLCINAAINPLTAIHKVKNGTLLESRFTDDIKQVCREATTLANALNINIDYGDVLEKVYHVCEATANNYSSMHQDVTHKRQTEIMAISGYIVNQGNKKGVQVTKNAYLMEAVKQLEI